MTFKSIARYFLAASFLVLIFVWIPSRYSLLLTYLSIFAVIAGLSCGMLAIHYRNAALRVVYLLNPPLLLYLIMLRMWDRLVGLSWVFILASLAGAVCVGLLPYVNKRLSGILYREQHAPRTKVGQWIFLSLPGILFIFLVIMVASAILSFIVAKGQVEDTFTPLVIALLSYLVTLGIVFHVMYRHANGLTLWITPIIHGENEGV